MSYATGTATDSKDLLQKLVTFLTSNGWTQDASASDGTGWRAHLHKGSDYINLRALYNESVSGSNVANPPGSASYGLLLYMGTGYSGASAWYAQGGGPVGNGGSLPIVASTILPSGSITAYHFFGNSSNDVIDVVIERSPNVFGHFGWGRSLTKLGTFTGGQYFYGACLPPYIPTTSYNEAGFLKSALHPMVYGAPGTFGSSQCLAWVRADIDTFTGKWLGIGSTTLASSGGTGKAGASLGFESAPIPTELPSYQSFELRQTSAMGTQANLVPIRIAGARDSSGYSLLGSMPAVFLCTAVGNGFSSAADYTLGADTYKVFPGPATVGYAIKKT